MRTLRRRSTEGKPGRLSAIRAEPQKKIQTSVPENSDQSLPPCLCERVNAKHAGRCREIEALHGPNHVLYGLRIHLPKPESLYHDKNRRERWLAHLGITEDDIGNLCAKNTVVCYTHFRPECFEHVSKDAQRRKVKKVIAPIATTQPEDRIKIRVKGGRGRTQEAALVVPDVDFGLLDPAEAAAASAAAAAAAAIQAGTAVQTPPPRSAAAARTRAAASSKASPTNKISQKHTVMQKMIQDMHDDPEITVLELLRLGQENPSEDYLRRKPVTAVKQSLSPAPTPTAASTPSFARKPSSENNQDHDEEDERNQGYEQRIEDLKDLQQDLTDIIARSNAKPSREHIELNEKFSRIIEVYESMRRLRTEAARCSKVSLAGMDQHTDLKKFCTLPWKVMGDLKKQTDEVMASWAPELDALEEDFLTELKFAQDNEQVTRRASLKRAPFTSAVNARMRKRRYPTRS
mmetsp:Transcript_19922/g.39107  ORF Transcript_19922/g.39107 Transcript_19922/m.39107 type:complete len:461 (+) Transcript_19922:468-1850(+)|eukprot:CAMPEP_0171501148 /NCGR_PEP_ID=MMETSP0958-20121227/9398_1 /TAXON_ID=87120 /ORGANISM="Aurantiochytrium limacinum, Strain ATCCMYA-1381" /LENGTH=460 /DNA_ID=CAMNT_0012035933 /DNA_START=421 /DNA_END=1803 /DNA_ORIENTATION=+